MCTTMILTRGAMACGSMVVTHSDDDELSDQRIVRVPAADHAPGALRAVLPESYDYPRLVAKDRGPFYDTPGWPETTPIGWIPQVAHTYAYVDGNYGVQNEAGLMMGECTNGARYQPAFVTAEDAARDGRHVRLFYSSELSRVALERCATARDAVRLMGALIDAWGYYGEGETLLVADGAEAFVFEMCALPDETRHSAWIAQRVPDGHLFVAANTFRIRDVSGHDPDQIHSDHLLEDLKAVGWWDPAKGPLDWLPAVSEGEYNHPYYSLRRIWRVMDRANPDLALCPWVEGTYTRAYPFSIPPARPLALAEVFALYRDHYEGTEFDLTQGLAAGPYGDPTRLAGPYDRAQNGPDGAKILAGAWERPISVYYQGYSYALQSRPGVSAPLQALMWLAPDVAATSVFAPFFVGGDLPAAYQTGNPREYDRATAWWLFDFVANWARLNWRRMVGSDIRPLQQALEAAALDDAARHADCGAAALTAFNAAQAGRVLDAWRALGDRLVAKYADGYVNPPPERRAAAVDIGYPATWLGAAGYAEGPTRYAMPLRPR